MNTYDRVYAAIDLDAVLHNIKEMKQQVAKNTKIMAVIKTDGYGHGAVPIGRELDSLEEIWGFAVATAEEGIILRRNGLKKPILVLGATFPGQYAQMARQDIRPTVYSLQTAIEMAETMAEISLDLSIHVKIDTGLSRLGFQVTKEDADKIAQVQSLKHIVLEGVFTHFAKADAVDKTMAQEQLEKFANMLTMLKAKGVVPAVTHSSNSAGIIDLPKANMDIVRAGISLYGMLPSDEVEQKRLQLKPVMELKSKIVHLKELEPGRAISYGATYTTQDRQKIATIPVGYGDGYPRSLSNKGYVLIQGHRAPICGRICMDQFMVDVTGIPDVTEGEEVVLVGRSKDLVLSMEEIGALSGRFHYEFACDLGKRIPRVYYKNGQIIETRDYFGE